MSRRTLHIDTLARVEGEGALTVRLKDGVPESVELRIFEPPRFFEAFLRGRGQDEVHDLTARICGICPVAYQMSAVHAIEAAHGVRVEGELRRLRRLLYCGEWIESHALHMFLLHLPDFLGVPDAIAMAREHRALLERGLRIKKTGNALVTALGGRAIHPVNVRLGGFHRVPRRAELQPLRPELLWAREAMEELLEWMAGLAFPNFERDYELVALQHPDEYPFCEGRVVSSKGLSVDVRDFESVSTEEQVPYTTALHSVLRGRDAYLCGPLARFNLDFEQLGSAAQAIARRIGLTPPCLNPFRMLLVRGVEVVQALDEAIRIVDTYEPPEEPWVPVPIGEAAGCAATEAPRGLLYHRYAIDERGLIRIAKIVPPTSQNQKSIERDLFELAPRLAKGTPAEATFTAERAIRNHDPCISCSTHFLRLKIERS